MDLLDTCNVQCMINAEYGSAEYYSGIMEYNVRKLQRLLILFRYSICLRLKEFNVKNMLLNI